MAAADLRRRWGVRKASRMKWYAFNVRPPEAARGRGSVLRFFLYVGCVRALPGRGNGTSTHKVLSMC